MGVGKAQYRRSRVYPPFTLEWTRLMYDQRRFNRRFHHDTVFGCVINGMRFRLFFGNRVPKLSVRFRVIRILIFDKLS